ncbi:MAG: gamma-glutamyltransferase [Chryseolinea sp.]
MPRHFIKTTAAVIVCFLLVSMTKSPKTVRATLSDKPNSTSAARGSTMSPPGREPLYARHGMVVSSSAIASEIGRDILKQGGNAIDAAVATAFAMAVTWPSAGNIGGGGFIL